MESVHLGKIINLKLNFQYDPKRTALNMWDYEMLHIIWSLSMTNLRWPAVLDPFWANPSCLIYVNEILEHLMLIWIKMWGHLHHCGSNSWPIDTNVDQILEPLMPIRIIMWSHWRILVSVCENLYCFLGGFKRFDGFSDGILVIRRPKSFIYKIFLLGDRVPLKGVTYCFVSQSDCTTGL